MEIAAYQCPRGHDLELLAGTQRADDDGSDEAGSPREPAYCRTCGAYFWVEHNNALVLVRNAMLDTTTLNHMAGLLIDRGRALQAQSLLEKSIQVSERLRDFRGRALGLCQLSRLLALGDRTEDARIVLGDSLATVQAIDDESVRADLLHEMAGLMAASGEVEEALQLYLQSLALKERIGDPLGEASTLHEIAALRLDRGQADEAIWLCREALAIRERLGDDRGRAASLRLMAGIHTTRGQVERALERLDESLDAFDRACDLHGRASTLGHKAGLLADIGRINDATKLLREAMTLNKQIGSARGVARILHRTACLMAAAGKVDGAMRFLQKAQAIYEKIGNVQGQSETLHEMGYQLSLRGRVDAARTHLEDALTLAELIGHTRGQARTLARLAQLTFAEDPVEAFLLLDRSERLLSRVGAGRDLLHTLQTHRAVARATRKDAEFAVATANLVFVHLLRGDPARAAENAIHLAQRLPLERLDLVHRLTAFALLLAEQAKRQDGILALAREVMAPYGMTLHELRRRTPEVAAYVYAQGARAWVEVMLGEWLLDAPQPLVNHNSGSDPVQQFP